MGDAVSKLQAPAAATGPQARPHQPAVPDGSLGPSVSSNIQQQQLQLGTPGDPKSAPASQPVMCLGKHPLVPRQASPDVEPALKKGRVEPGAPMIKQMHAQLVSFNNDAPLCVETRALLSARGPAVAGHE
jgi:hypothetical protein